MYNLFILQIICGVFALGIGAEMIVRSSVNLAKTYRVSGYFIGFTIIALGTSLPELAATIQALSEIDSIEIALGNIIGSNIANILLVLGFVSIIFPIDFKKDKESKQSLIMLAITFIVLLLFYLVINGIGPNPFIIGLLLIILFFCFLLWQYFIESKITNSEENLIYKYSQIQSYMILLIGLLLLYYGSKYFIIGSQKLAINLNISETVIGLTLVAFGTSLPELATGIIAAIRRQSGIAIGTILGSNIYNIVGILAIIILFKSDSFIILSYGKSSLMINIFIMTFVTILFVILTRLGLPFLKFKPYHIGMRNGALFLFLYVVYILFNYFKIQ